MLVLTRKTKQQIQIGRDISITVLRVKGQTVRIGIDAPADVRVRRSELFAFDAEHESAGVEEGRLLEKRPTLVESSEKVTPSATAEWSPSADHRGMCVERPDSGSSRQVEAVTGSSHDRRSGVAMGRERKTFDVA